MKRAKTSPQVSTARDIALAAAVARYHAGCLRTIGAQNVAQRDLRTTKKAAIPCDLGELLSQEELLAGRSVRISAPTLPPNASDIDREIYEHRLLVWDRLRELTRKAALEAHSKEVAYGAPLLRGVLAKTGGRLESVLAPLFTQAVRVSVEDDGSVVIAASDEPPRFNTALWSDALTKGDADQVITLGINAQADLADGYDHERVRTLLNAIATILPALKPATPNGEVHPWPSRPTPSEISRAAPHLELHEGAGLYLSNRASPYLLADLEAIGADPTGVLVEDRPLSVLISKPLDEARPEPARLDIDEVGFPFPSNEAQRRVADALEKNRLVVVQGPPGNGKSLTIANLVCHLVGQAKSVLVVSHKDQALSVVRDKLEETNLQFLYASLIGGTGQAKRELQGQIQDVRAFAASVDSTALRRQLNQIEKRRAENGERYRQLRDEFNDRAEGEQQEAARLVLELEGLALLPEDDPVPEEPAVVMRDLLRLNELARQHMSDWAWLSSTSVAGELDTTSEQAALRDFLALQRSRIRAAREEPIRALVRSWQNLAETEPALIEAAQRSIDDIEARFVPSHAAVLGHAERDQLLQIGQALAASETLLEDCEKGLTALRDGFTRLRELASSRRTVAADPVRRHEVVAMHGHLASLLKRRAARRWLDQHAPGAAGLDADAVTKWAQFWDCWSDLQTVAEGLGGGMRTDLPDEYAPDDVAALTERCALATQLARGIQNLQRTAAETRLRLPVDALRQSLSVSDCEQQLDACRAALAAIDADRRGNEAKLTPDVQFAAEKVQRLDELVDTERYDEAQELIGDLEAVIDALAGLAERNHLHADSLNDMSATYAAIEQAARSGQAEPAFLADLETALAVHPKVVRLREINDGSSTREIAATLTDLRSDVLEDARKLLGLRIQQRIVKGFGKPSFLASLQAFKKAISASAKRYERFEELKNSSEFDVRVLTEVFPCWIMRPEDACRVFPLNADAFDVVIFDEASQCNPDQALPLFARGGQVAIFGDEKQLSNEDLRRSLSVAANQSLLQQSGVLELDPAGLFNQTRHSLLDLASHRQQASLLLNEHFRCRPELIAFSNRQFYGNTLRIMRDRDDARGVGPAMIIREVTDVPPLGRAKINQFEAEALVDELERRLADPRYSDQSFGVLSLFREQIEHVEGLIEVRIPPRKREQHRLICSTVDGFQGDERDVILYSWRFTPTCSPSILSFTSGEAGSQRANVALTRARHQAIHFISAPVERFPVGASNVTGFLHHARDPESLLEAIEARVHREPIDEMRTRVAGALRSLGFEVDEQFVACGVSVDLRVTDSATGSRIALFVDSELDPHPPAVTVRRVDGHGLLERAGWTVTRIPATEALDEDRLAAAVKTALSHASRQDVSDGGEPTYATVAAPGSSQSPVVPGPIAPEDRADYVWDPSSVEARLSAGEVVFHSDFECNLYDRLAADTDLRVVPQWPSRNKSIDLVVTDREGRRLAVEADGDQHHETLDGSLIPEDIQRQELLEAAGWVFHRVRHKDFLANPDSEIEGIRSALARQPVNPLLAAEPSANTQPESAPAAPPPDSLQGALDLDDGASALKSPLEMDEAVSIPDEEPSSAGKNSGANADFALEPTPSSAGHESSPGTDREVPFDAVPLSRISPLIAALVSDEGRVPDDELPIVMRRAGFVVPPSRGRLLNSFAWYANAKRWIQRDSSGTAWIPGNITPDGPVGDTRASILSLSREARALFDEGLDSHRIFERLIEAVGNGSSRPPKPFARAVGAAIRMAERPQLGEE